MYEPPTKQDYQVCLETHIKAYDLGYFAAKQGKSESDNPYKSSNHERDTSFEDILVYNWYSGFWDFQDK